MRYEPLEGFCELMMVSGIIAFDTKQLVSVDLHQPKTGQLKNTDPCLRRKREALRMLLGGSFNSVTTAR